MGTYIHQPGVYPGLTPSYSHPHQSKNVQDSRPGPLGLFARALRNPALALERLIEEFNPPIHTGLSAEQELDNEKTILRLKLHSASCFRDWRSAAAELDDIEGHNTWKTETQSAEYNYALVQSRLDQLEDARISCDAERMLFLVRTSLTRHLGGMGNLHLYKHSRVGTKHLIERYIASALNTLRSLLEITQRQSGSVLDSRDLLQQVLAARQAFGRSALLLSGGGTFGMNHIGVIKCLWENRLLPRIVSGASAGSIVSAVLCTRTDDEIPSTIAEFCFGDLEVFTKTGVDDGMLQQVKRFLKTGALFDIANLKGVMKDLLGDMTFQEAYNRTRRILNICVSPAGIFELPRLLNYVTAPNVIIWSAVAASCSVPFVFSPAGLLAKDPRTGSAVPWNPAPQRYIDGSVDNDLPMTRLAEMFNVNHFIVSQVNPHVVPFLAKEEDQIAFEAKQAEVAVDPGPSWLNTLANLAKDEAMHRMHVLSELGIFATVMTKTRSILSQRYSGDITIFPEISYSQFPTVLQNPTTDFMVQASLQGERATWPKLSRIQNHCAIELALDDAVQQLRARVAFSPSQVDLRLTHMSRPASRAGSEGGRQKSSRRKRVRHSEPQGRNRSFSSSESAEPQARNRSFSSSESDVQRPDVFTDDVSQVAVNRSNESRNRAAPRLPLPIHLSLDTTDTALRAPHREAQTAPSSPSDDSSASDSKDNYFSSSDEDDTSAQNQFSLQRSPSSHSLFPHASQPATPSHRNSWHPSYFASTSPLNFTRSPATSSSKATASLMSPRSTANLPLLAMSSSNNGAPSRNEVRQSDQIKPLVRTRSSRSMSGASPTTPVEVDVDDVGGAALRKRRSMSTGLRGLKPPLGR